jgi:hypothetical protein
MADPITISLAAIPGMLAAIVKLLAEAQRFINEALGAPREIRAVRRELDALRGAFIRLQTVLEIPNPHALPPELTAGFPAMIRYCRGTIKTLKNILRQSFTSIFGRFMWVLSGKDRVMSLLAHLERQKSTLNMYIQVFELYELVIYFLIFVQFSNDQCFYNKLWIALTQ